MGFLFPQPAFADTAMNKLVRGIVNLTTGWLEIPKEMAEREPDGTVVMGPVVHGFMQGLTHGTQRTLYGFWDILTFWAPPYEGPEKEPETLIDPYEEPY